MISTRQVLGTLQKLLIPSEFAIVEQIEQLKDAFELRTSPRCYHASLCSIQFPLNKLPPNFLDFFNNNQIMTYPVFIDNPEDRNTVDFQNLLRWWQEDPQHLHKNPFTFQPIQTLQINNKLKAIIDAFVAYEVEQAQGYTLSNLQIVQALKKIDSYVATFKNAESCQTRIARKNLDKTTLERLSAHNLDHEVIDHPVRVDGSYVIDYQQLLNWWHSHPDHQYKNPFTDQRIKSISYNVEFKYELEKYATPEVRPLYSSQLP